MRNRHLVALAVTLSGCTHVERTHRDSLEIAGGKETEPHSLDTVSNTTTKPVFDFRGERFGDPIPADAPTGSCEPKIAPGIVICVNPFDDVAGVSLLLGRVYVDNGLAALTATFSSKRYEDLVAAIETKYGPSASTEYDDVQNRMGATFANETKHWEFSTGRMNVSKYSDKVTQGLLGAYSATGAQEIQKRKEAAAREAALRDLGPRQ